VSAITLGRVKSEIDLDMCVGCGHCVATCPNNAISFELDPQVDVVGKLMAHVEAFVDVT
jgi:ferredoxin